MGRGHWPDHYVRPGLESRWMERGACLRFRDLPWTADRTSTRERVDMAAVCGACPVLVECRLFAARARVSAGFWASAPRGQVTGTTITPPDADVAGSGAADVGGAA
jgi:hypothetical protein